MTMRATILIAVLVLGCGSESGGLSDAPGSGGSDATGGAPATGGAEEAGGAELASGGSATGGSQTGGDDACPDGSESCTCYGNDTCDGELACLSGVCVDAGAGGTGGAGTGGAPSGGVAPTGGTPTGGISTGGQFPICTPGDTNYCSCNGDWSNPGITECSPDGLSWADCVCPVGTGGSGTGGSGTGGSPGCDAEHAETFPNPGRRTVDGEGCYLLGDVEEACTVALDVPEGFIGRYETATGVSGAITSSGSQDMICPVLLDFQTPDTVVVVSWS